MKNSKILFHETAKAISIDESAAEIHEMVYTLFECIWGISKTEVIAEKMVPYAEEHEQRLARMVKRLNGHEPVQYVVEEARFFERKFQVNPAVLIPRPETEELIRVVLSYRHTTWTKGPVNSPMRILDIGTGSGCVAITLALEIPGAEVYATDVSNAALAVAIFNAGVFRVPVNLFEHDILKHDIPVSGLDVIVSNPPYVTKMEMEMMNRNVVDNEPHLALFVSDDDPLIFYRAIVQNSLGVLNVNGLLAVEINERFGEAVSRLFLESGFDDVDVIKDASGKDRIVKGIKRQVV